MSTFYQIWAHMGRGESLLLRETKYHRHRISREKKIPHEPPRLAMGDSEYRDTTLSRGMEAKVQINQHKKEKNDSKLKRAFKPATLFYYHFLLSAA